MLVDIPIDIPIDIPNDIFIELSLASNCYLYQEGRL